MSRKSIYKYILTLSIILITVLSVLSCKDSPRAATHTITYVSNGGTAVCPQIVADGHAATKPANPTKSGYTFAGWYWDETLKSPYDWDTKVNLNTILYAGWKEGSEPELEAESSDGEAIYTVIYSAIDAEGQAPTDSKKYKEKDQVVVKGKGTLTKTGYTFLGWGYAGKNYQPDTTFTMPKGNVIFEAQWQINSKQSYTVTFDADGGSPTPSDQSIEDGKTASKPVDPTRTGYSFEGWYNGSVKYDFATEVHSDLNLKAGWTTQTVYKVTYDANGANSGTAPDPSESIAGGKITLPLVGNMSKTGSAFAGWREASITGAHYEGGATYTVTKDVTMYAEWAILSEKITGIELDKTTANVNKGSNITLVATIIPAGAYSAVTWSSSNENIAKVSQSGVVTGVSVGEATIYATSVEGSFVAECKITVKDEGVWDVEVIDRMPTGTITATEVNNVWTFTLTDTNPVNGPIQNVRWIIDNIEKTDAADQFTYILENPEARTYTIVCVLSNNCGVMTIANTITGKP